MSLAVINDSPTALDAAEARFDATEPPCVSLESPRSARRAAHLKRLSLSGPHQFASMQQAQEQPDQSRSAIGSMEGPLFTPQRSSPAHGRFSPAISSPPSSGSSSYNFRRHSRRQSSISYNKDPSLTSPIGPSSIRAPLSPNTPLSARGSLRETIIEEEDRHSPRVPPSPTLGVSGIRPGATGGGPATLLEQHGDLLSFIAKKERKCLDLREELKREEDELKVLKARWESIMASSMRPEPAPEEVASPPSRRSVRHSIASSPAEFTSPPSAVPGAGIAVAAEALPDLNSAKRYLGGLMKSGIAGVNGLIEGLAAPPTDLPDLGTVKEEDEEEGDASMMSRTTSTVSSSAFSTVTRDSSLSSLESAGIDSDYTRTPSLETSTSSGSEDTLTTAEDFAPAVPPKSTTGPPRTIATSKVEKHARRRSAFDMFGQAASGFTTSLGRKLTEVAGSETFKKTQRTTMNALDSFERTLTDAIAIDMAEDQQSAATTPTLSASSPQPNQNSFWSFSKSPKQPQESSLSTAELDVGQLLDGVPAFASVTASAPTRYAKPLLDELDLSNGLHGALHTTSLPSPISPTGVPIQSRTNRIPPRHAKRASMPAFNRSPSPQPTVLPSVIESNGDGDDWANW